MNDRGNGLLIPWHLSPRPLLLAAVAVGLAVRLAPLFQDFWFDEVISLDLAFRRGDIADAFRPDFLLVDNPVNHAFLRLLGPSVPLPCYRLLSLAAGIGSLALLWKFARPGGRRVAETSLLLGSISYTLVHYSSEARGYATVAFLALASTLSLENDDGNGTFRAVPFWILCAAGILAHPIFLFHYAGTLAYSAHRSIAAGERPRELLRSQIRIHGPAAVFLAAYLYWLLGHTPGGAPPHEIRRVLLDFVDFSFGIPTLVPWWAAGPPLLLLFIVLLIGLRAEWENGRRGRALMLSASVAAAFLSILSGRPSFFSPRYLIVLLPFLLVNAAQGLDRLWRRGNFPGGAALLFLAIFLAGSAHHLYRFINDGRGHYRKALSAMAAGTTGGVVSVGGDDDVRTEYLCRFHSQWLPPGKELFYVRNIQAHPEAEWYIEHWIDRQGEAASEAVLDGRIYKLVDVYPHYGLSGFSWAIYRGETGPDARAESYR